MQSIITLLAVLVGVAFADNMTISSDDLNQKNKDISATEYLKRIFKNSLMHYDSRSDVSSQDDFVDNLEIKLSALGLKEASDIARQVDLKQIIRDSSLTSFTLCLPSDEAVQRWRQELPRELRPEALKQLVKAWIVPDVVRFPTITNNKKVQSLNGAKLRYNVYYKDKIIYTVDGARIAVNLEVARNQIVQIIDKVIYPLPVRNVVQTLVDVESFSMIVDLLRQAELSDPISETDPITVLVPTNKAFQALAPTLIKDLMTNQTKLRNLLKYHVISDVKYSVSLSSGQRITTALQGNQISVNIDNGRIILSPERNNPTANVIKADIPTTNGVIQIIDQVLLPF